MYSLHASEVECFGKGTKGDAANVVLAAAGYNFRRLIRWLRFLLLEILAALSSTFLTKPV